MITQIASDVRSNLVVGIVGGGFMGEVHSRAARAAGAAIAGVTSSTHSSAEKAANRLHIPVAYESVAEMLEDPAIDLVHICSPNSSHASIAEAALEAGKHVICEKPLATNPEQAESLLHLAAVKGKVAAVPFVYRFHPLVREARSYVRKGSLGTTITVQGSYFQDWLLSTTDDNWRVNDEVGGPSRAFADIGSHLCDLVEFVTDERISDLCAQTRTVFDKRTYNTAITTEDVAAVMFRTAGGLLGTLMVSQVAPGRKNKLSFEINGTTQSLFFDQEQPESLWVGAKTGSRVVVRSPEDNCPDAARLSRVPAGHPQGYQDAFNNFVADTYAAIAGETPEGLPTFADGLRSAHITAAVLDSARNNSWVSVPDSPTAFPARSSKALVP